MDQRVVAPGAVQTYAMEERSAHREFDIRDQNVRAPLTQPHRHDYFQIMVTLEGTAQQTIGGSVRPLRPGTLTFVLPYRVHLVPLPAGSRFVVLNFAQRFLRPELDVDPLDLEDVPVSRVPELAPFLYQEYLDFVVEEGRDRDHLLGLLDQMIAENRERRFGSLEILRGKLLQLIGLTCRRHETELLRLATARTNSSGRRDALLRVSRYIRDHLSQEMCLTDAAAAAYLSPNYLAHLLKKEIGKSFTELVTERRMERAQELLTNTRMRIAEVAHATGFADEGYFTRRFRQCYGRSPRAFRETVRAAVSQDKA
ncbi:AraC family transcriptional regulator [Massilia sp. WF1]|uniref:AraC family transcriptional regulator n=1 Tax=unclassified Massilia TaxID=2609279 RepID=UPI00068B9A64|nr:MULTISPECIES: AraC family transcriptional regulator [unclassified Massilia]ALK97626.1 AraC family transcriptional regulator [Massilia sp. WG5]KNZ67794.1 AraC family transcriptional regulator [Massilia sp. WF1]